MHGNEKHTGRVIVAIARREPGPQALAWAAAAAAARGCPVELVHYWQPRTISGRPGGIVLPGRAEFARPGRPAQALVDEAVEHIRALNPLLQVSGRLLPGDLETALPRLLNPDDLLVLPLRSSHRIAARERESASTHLIDHAPCPVVVLPPRPGPHTGPLAGHVVIGVDDSPSAPEAIRLGFTEAVRLDAPVAVLHAYQLDVPEPAEPHLRTRAHTATATALARASTGARLLVLGREQRRARPGPATLELDLVLTGATSPVLLTAPVPNVPVPVRRSA